METKQTSHIYALLDPLTFLPCYIGRTASSLVKRLSQHLADSKLRNNTPLASWLRGLVATGQRPFIALLESVPEAQWRQAERNWIAFLRAEGAALVNGHGGGTGPAGGYRWTAESVEKMRRSKVGRSRGGSSRFPGVSKRGKRWAAQLCGCWLGLHATEDEAFRTYRDAYHARFDGDLPGWENWTPADQADINMGNTVRPDAVDPAAAALAEIAMHRPAPKGI
jgi:hypothetical protein